jgi:GDP-L-fucose synthase
MREEHLLTGPLEPTNEGYAIAKIAGLELAKMYRRQHGLDAISLMPTNLYGTNDNFDLEHSHVLPALLRKVHDAKQRGDDHIEVWGTGNPRREFLHVDDLADATVFALTHYDGETHLNVGTGEDISIRELAETIADVVGWEGELRFDPTMPDGTRASCWTSCRTSTMTTLSRLLGANGRRCASATRSSHGAGRMSRLIRPLVESARCPEPPPISRVIPGLHRSRMRSW